MADVTSTAGRSPWVGTSWKMNKVRAEAVAYLTELVRWAVGPHAAVARSATLAVFPPFTVLTDASATLAAAGLDDLDGPRIRLGGQNMHWEPRGAKTAEISAELLLDTGVSMVEIGHFERRTAFGETDQTVNLKVLAALRSGLDPVICVGDTTLDRQWHVSAETVTRQVKIALSGVSPDAAGRVVVAYEPGWAIGDGGIAAAPHEFAPVMAAVRAAVDDCLGPDAGSRVRVVYGGSVSSDNVAALAAAGIDGVFVGRAALAVHSFIDIAQTFCAHAPALSLVPSTPSADPEHSA